MTRHNIPRLVLLVFLISLIGNPVATVGQQDDRKKSKKGVYTVSKKGPGQQPQAQPQPEVPHGQSGGKALPRKPSSERTSPQGSPQGGASSGQGAAEPYVTETVLRRKLGFDGLKRLLGQIETSKPDPAGGQGAPSSSVWWENAGPRTGNDDGLGPSGTPVFQRGGSQSRPSEPVPVTSGTYKRATVEDAKREVDVYGSYKGGIGLEGIANGLGEINSVRYDSRFNAFILNDRAAYFVKVPPQTVAVLCRAIAEDEKERVGVSLGDKQIVYGKVPEQSNLAWDLKMADHFLGSIVFAQTDWMGGYRFAAGFKPERREDNSIVECTPKMRQPVKPRFKLGPEDLWGCLDGCSHLSSSALLSMS